MDTLDHATYHVWIHFIPTTLYPRRDKTIWSELELNPGPHASQAIALTTRPWLLGLLRGGKVASSWLNLSKLCRKNFNWVYQTELPMQYCLGRGQIFWFFVYFLSFKTTRLLRPRASSTNQDLIRKSTPDREKCDLLGKFLLLSHHFAMNKTCSMDINCSWRQIQTIA